MNIAVMNYKGGVGKTTTSIMLAVAATRDGKTVTVLDADAQQGSATLWEFSATENGNPLPFAVKAVNKPMLSKIRPDANPDNWLFIDCPPAGNLNAEAIAAADFVVIPSTQANMDFQQMWQTVADCKERGLSHAILLTRCRPHTKAASAAAAALSSQDTSYFETQIPLREDVKNLFGICPGKDLYGYEEAYKELKGAIE